MPRDREMKDDLLRLLPEKVQLDLMWNASEASLGFAQFRDLVVQKSARIMNIQMPQRSIHQVSEDIPALSCRPPVDANEEGING